MDSLSARRAVVLALVLLGSYSYFYVGGGWNQNTRFNLTRALVEQGTVVVDRYHENTGDKAFYGGHYYTDKAPGASLTAVPFVAAVRLLMRVAGADVQSRESIVGLAYVATIAAAGLPAALAAALVFWVALQLGATERGALVGAVACGLGTPFWAYATILYGHTLAAACLMIAFSAAVQLRAPSSPHRDGRLGALAGLALGWSVVTEFPASVPAGLIAVLVLWLGWKNDARRLPRLAVAIGVGALPAAVILLTYNWVAFGSPFHIAYTSEHGSFEAMKTGLFGVNLPSLSAAREILVGEYRGLLPLAPILIAAPVGFFFWCWRKSSLAPAIAALAIVVYYLSLTAGYAYWSGGWSYASRHLGPALPFACLGIPPVWDRARAGLRAALLILLAIGAGQALVAVATTPQPPSDIERPMRDLLWPIFKDGDFPIVWQSVLDYAPPPGAMSDLVRRGVPKAGWNLGQLAGLERHSSLVPLGLWWTMGAIVWVSLVAPIPRRQKR